MENNSLMDSISKAEAKYKKAREVFIQQRSVQEKQFDDFILKILELDTSIRDELGITENMTYRKLFPSLWCDPIPESQYCKEYDEYLKLQSNIDSVFQRINAQAKQEYDAYVKN